MLRRFVEHVVALCVAAGLVWGQERITDTTRVPANAARDSLAPRLRAAVDHELVALFDGGEVPGCDANASATIAGWKLLDACRLGPQRRATGSYERISSRKISRTDPDATSMQLRDRRTMLGYQDQYLIDGGHAQIILHAFVTSGDVSESQLLIDQLRRTLFRRKPRPAGVIADASYWTGPNVHASEELGIRGVMLLHEGDTSSHSIVIQCSPMLPSTTSITARMVPG